MLLQLLALIFSALLACFFWASLVAETASVAPQMGCILCAFIKYGAPFLILSALTGWFWISLSQIDQSSLNDRSLLPQAVDIESRILAHPST